uniref:Uncharacterized protein n=1 Tax=Strongyloides stercoralis TaxID=6248 RepID=A0A0K0E148_STRER
MMDKSKDVLYKICGKIQLVKQPDNSLDSFYIIQWDSNTGPFSLRSFNSLSNYVDEIAEYEAKSTRENFINRVQGNLNEISNDQANFIINVVSQYKEHDYPHSNEHGLMEALPSSYNKTNDLDDHYDHISSSNFSNQNNISNLYASNKNLLSQYDDDFNENEEILNLVGGDGDFNSDFINYDIFQKQNCLKTGENEILKSDSTNNILDCTKVDRGFSPSLEKNDSNISVGSFVETYSISPKSCCSDFTLIEESNSCKKCSDYENKWIQLIKEDMKESGDVLNWNNLEIISEIKDNSKHYFVGYDKITKYMSLIADEQVPESNLYKCQNLQKMYKHK